MNFRSPLLLDGGMWTGLFSRGLPKEALPEEWVLERPHEVRSVHADHVRGGAELILTATFNLATPRLSARVGAGRDELIAKTAVHLAHEAAPQALVAGSLGGTGAPGVTLEVLEKRYRIATEALARSGAEMIWLETQTDLEEALAALAASLATGLPTVVTFAFREEAGRMVAGRGVPAEAWLSAAAARGASAVGVNCIPAGPALTRLAFAARALPVPFVAKPSPGTPGAEAAPASFAAAFGPSIEAGARVIGGCCGATGDHLAALAPLLAQVSGAARG